MCYLTTGKLRIDIRVFQFKQPLFKLKIKNIKANATTSKRNTKIRIRNEWRIRKLSNYKIVTKRILV